MATRGYCFKCDQEREIANAVEVTMKNGRPATKGVCPGCGMGLFLMGPVAPRVDEPHPTLVASSLSTTRSHGDDEDTTDPRPP